MPNLKPWLAAAALTLLGALAYQEAGRPAVERLLRASAEPTDGGGVELWRVEPIYHALAGKLFRRAAVLAWTFPLFLWLFSRMRRSRRRAGLSGLLFSGYVAVFSWAAAELLLAPFLINRLDLYNFYFVLDVDHRLPVSHPGIGTNADGLRNAREGREHPEGAFNLLVAGDSFTFGFRVEREEAFPAQLERILAARRPELDLRAVNLGWTSASPLLSLRLLEEVGDGYHPDALIYCLDMTDFHDDIKYRNMLERRGIYWWYDKAPITLRLLRQFWPAAFDALYWRSNDNLPRERFFHSEQPLEGSRPFLEPALDNLRRLDRWARDRGIPFAVLVLPRTYQYSSRESPENREAEFYTVQGPFSLEPLRFLEEAGSGESFPILSILPAFRDTEVFPTAFGDDPHWTVAGHRLAAEAIAEAIEASGLLPEASP